MKILIKASFTFIFLLIAFAIAAPFFLSTKMGTSTAMYLIEKASKGKCHIETLKISWISRQEISGFFYQSADDSFSLSFKSLKTPDSLLRVALNKGYLSQVIVDSPQAQLQEISHLSKSQKKPPFAFLPAKSINITNGRISIRQKNKTPISFKDIGTSILYNHLTHEYICNLAASSQYENQSGTVNIQSKGAINPNDLLENPKSKTIVNITRLPLKGIDECLATINPSLSYLLEENIGPFVSVQSHINLSQDSYAIDIDAKSKFFNAKIRTNEENSTGKISGRMTPALLAMLSEHAQIENPVEYSLRIDRLKVPTINNKLSFKNLSGFILGKIDQLSFTNPDCQVKDTILSFKTNDFEKSLHINCNSSIFCQNISGDIHSTLKLDTPLSLSYLNASLFSKKIHTEIAALSNCEIHIKGENLSSLKLIGKVEGQVFDSPLKKYIGETVNASVDSNLSLNSSILSETTSIHLSSKLFSAKANAKLSLNPLFIEFKKGVTASYNLSPSLWSEFFPTANEHIELKNNLSIDLVAKPFHIKYAYNAPHISYFETSLKSSKATFLDIEQNKPIELEKIQAYLTYDQKNYELNGHFETLIPTKPTCEIEGSVAINQLNIWHIQSYLKASIATSLQASYVPSVFLDSFAFNSMNYKTLIGENFSTTCKFTQTPKLRECIFSIESDLLSAKGDFDFTNGINLKRPLEINATITPESFLTLSKIHHKKNQVYPTYFILNAPCYVDFKINSFSLPYSSPINFDNLSIKAEGLIKNLDVKDVNSDIITQMKKASFSIAKKSQKQAGFEIESKLASYSKNDTSAQEGNIKGYGTIQNLSSASSIDLHLKLSKFPMTIFDMGALLISERPILPSAICGSYANAEIDASIKNNSGPITCKLHSPYANCFLNGVIINHKLMLKDAFKASLKWNKRLEALLFNRARIYSVSIPHPITFTIGQQGLMIPLNHFTIDSIQAPSLSLNLGKITVENRGNVEQLNSIFKLNNNRQIQLWFMPFDMQLSNGIAQVQRTEILYDHRYQVCTWGEINLAKQYVNMTLGLTEQSLSRALGIQGLPNDYVLQVPLRGPYNDVQIDKAVALTKIGALIAQTQSSHFGDFGGVIDIFGSIINDQSSVPPPKKPFPWGEISYTCPPTKIKAKKHKKRAPAKELYQYSLPFDPFNRN